MSQAFPPSFAAFAGFVGAIFAMGSRGIDALLPALPDLADSFQGYGNQVQFPLTGLVIGMGLGATLIAAAGMIGGGVLAVVHAGLAFDGSPVPLIAAILLFAMLSRLALYEGSLK